MRLDFRLRPVHQSTLLEKLPIRKTLLDLCQPLRLRLHSTLALASVELVQLSIDLPETAERLFHSRSARVNAAKTFFLQADTLATDIETSVLHFDHLDLCPAGFAHGGDGGGDLFDTG